MIYWGLLLFFIFEYVRPATYVPALAALHLNSMIPLAIVVASLFVRRQVTNRMALGEPNTKIVLSLLGLIGLSVLTADVTLYAYSIFTAVLGYAMVLWVILREVTDFRRIKGVFAVLVLAHLFLAITTPQMFLDTAGRHYLASGTFLGDGNDFALSVNVTIALCLFLFLDSRRRAGRLLYSLCFLALLACVVLTKSRGGTVGLACLGLYFWMKSEEKVRATLISVVVIALVFFYAPGTYFERMTTIGDRAEGSSHGRLLAWGAGARMAYDNPLMGVGAGHFAVKYGVEYRPPGYGPTDIGWQTAHSIYFLVLGELGVPGLSALVIFIVYNLAANRRLARRLRLQPANPGRQRQLRLLTCLSAALIAFAANGAFLSAVYYPHAYILAGLLAAGRRVIREGAEAGTSEESTLALKAG